MKEIENIIHELHTMRVEPKEDVWLQLRKTFLGGSDTPALMGISKYRTAMDVYKEKVEGVAEVNDNISMKRGKALEDLVLDEYKNKYNATIFKTGRRIYKHPEYDYIGGTFDALCIRDDKLGILEVKTAVGTGTSKFKNGIPEMYIVQAHKYWWILESIVHKMYPKLQQPFTFCEIITMLDDDIMEPYRLSWNQELADKILNTDKSFWINNVIPEIPPITKDINSATIEATQDIVDIIVRRNSLHKQIKELEKQLDDYDKIVKEYLQDKDAITYNNNVLVAYSYVKPSEKFDVDKFKKEHADLYSQYITIKEGYKKLLYKNIGDKQ